MLCGPPNGEFNAPRNPVGGNDEGEIKEPAVEEHGPGLHGVSLSVGELKINDVHGLGPLVRRIFTAVAYPPYVFNITCYVMQGLKYQEILC
jgi:hypothetical protein